MDVKAEIAPLVEDFEWSAVGVLHNDGSITPIPRTSNPVTAIIEEQVITKIEETGYFIERPEHTRQYPDVTLHEDGQRIAIDIKTAKKESNRKLSGGITLGSCQSYFKEPNKDSAWSKYPYASYDEHWVLAILYQWNPKADADELITNTEVIMNEKWKVASKSNGSGTTNNIGSSTIIEKIKGDSDCFDSEEEFEKFWRQKA